MVLDKNHTAYYNTSIKAGKDSTIYGLLVYNKDHISNRFLPFPKNYKMEEGLDDFGFKNFTLNIDGDDTSVYYTRNFDYTIYRLTLTAIVPVYQFLFPIQYTLPDNFEQGKKIEILQKQKNIIARMFNFYKSGNVMYFDNGQHSYLYNISSRHLVDMDKIVSDPLSDDLPVTPSELNEGRIILLNFDGKHLYTTCLPHVLFDQMEATRKEKRHYQPDLVNFFSNKKNEKGNPVLIQIEFKDTF